MHLGLSDFYPFSINDVLRGNVSVNHAIYRHDLGFDIIPASLTDIEVNPRRLKYVLRGLMGKKDIILIDSAPGIDNEVRAAVEVADKVIIVTNPEVPALVDALRVKSLVENSKKEILGIVVNKIRGERFEVTDNEIETVTDLPIIAKIPHHKRVRESVAIKNPVVSYSPHSPASQEIKRLSHFLLGESIKIGFWERFKGLFRL